MNDKLILRKNILDTDFQKNLQIASIAVIILFTYLIGLLIATITHQINWSSFIDTIILFMISLSIITMVGFFLIPSVNKIRRISKSLRKIERSL